MKRMTKASDPQATSPDAPVTFRSLARREGHAWSEEPLPQEWPLQRWFAAVCDLPLDSFTVEDLARACRQGLYPEAVIPRCLEVLAGEPLAGELYDGELLAAVLGVPRNYWRQAPLEQEQCLRSVAQIASRQTEDTDLLKAIAEFASGFEHG